MREVKPWAEFYDRNAALSEAVYQVGSHVPLIECLTGHDRILEVGAGTGSLSGFLGSIAAVTVLELDLVVALRARPNPLSRRGRVDLVVGDGMRMPFEDDAFDAVYSQGLWEHFSDGDVHRFVAEGLRVAPLVLASVPSRWYPHLGTLWRPMLRGDERLLGRRAWVEILAAGGFHAEASYYPDVKLGTIGGWTLPWPVHVLIKTRRPT